MQNSVQTIVAEREDFTPAHFSAIESAPAQMTICERVVLYALVIGQRPRRILEIGTRYGGSALIMVSALDDLGSGELVSVDPNADIKPETWARISHRATQIPAPSPAALGLAAESGPFDFVLIDGEHSTEGVIRDVEGSLPFLVPGAYLVFHDAHHPPVAEGIRAALARHPELIDCGLISRERRAEPRGSEIFWGGFWLAHLNHG